MFVVIDRFEDKYAVVETGYQKMVNMPLDLVPDGAKEGDIIRIQLDPQKTKKQKEEINDLIDKLF